MTLQEKIAARIADVPVYRPGRAGTGPVTAKLSSNEQVLGPGPAVRAAIAAAADDVHHYPDEAEARSRLAMHLGVSVDQLILSNGSDELCYLLATLLLGPGRSAVVGRPAYAIDVTVSTISGATVLPVDLVDGAHDLPAMARVAREAGASMLWLPSPHNPTGVLAEATAVGELLEAVPEECVVVLDEAYRAFADPQSLPDVLDLLRAHPNLVVQRTLSKDWALAGLRVGYALGSPQLIEALYRLRPPFSVSAVAVAAINAGIDAAPWHAMVVDRVRHERALLLDALADAGIDAYPSQANFVAAHISHDVLAPALEPYGISVRPGENLQMPGWVRISVGWAPQMAQVRQALRTLKVDNYADD